MNEQELRRMVKEEIKQQFLNEGSQEELLKQAQSALEELKTLRGKSKSFYYNLPKDINDSEDAKAHALYYATSEAIKEISKAITQFKKIKVTQENIFKNFFKPDTSGPSTYSKEVIEDLLLPEYTEGLHYRFYKGVIMAKDKETAIRLRRLFDEFGMLKDNQTTLDFELPTKGGHHNLVFLNKRIAD